MSQDAFTTRVSRLVLLGAPGAGKGTQADRLAGRLGVPHISSGELLRAVVAAGSPLGRIAQGFIDKGELVPDDLALRVVLVRMRQPDAASGFILDGVPRTLPQARALDAELGTEGRPLQRVIELRVPTDQLIERIAGRATLGGRSDDRDTIVANRLQVYVDQTAPLVDYYRARGLLVAVQAVGTVDEVAERIEQALAWTPPT